jgi:hypothetical protein
MIVDSAQKVARSGRMCAQPVITPIWTLANHDAQLATHLATAPAGGRSPRVAHQDAGHDTGGRLDAITPVTSGM